LTSRNSQEEFWVHNLSSSYIEANPYLGPSESKLAEKAWRQILTEIDFSDVNRFLECGSNIGRNIKTLARVLPNAKASVIEINPKALERCRLNNEIELEFLGSIKDAVFSTRFDLVFTCGVLIHINPDDLVRTLTNMFQLSNKYVVVAEYFNRTPVTMNYHGEDEKLFKRDWGKFVLENFDTELLNYGFLWGQEYDVAGFDDITYWVFRKVS
jgi:pseudaminic acid biosynthesis-associated methylase